MLRKLIKPSILIKISMVFFLLTITEKSMAVRSYIDYPEFREEIANTCKSQTSPWKKSLQDTSERGINFPYRFACGKLVKVKVDWDVLSTEKDILHSKNKKDDKTEKSNLLSENRENMWIKYPQIIHPTITVESFFRDWKYQNIQEESDCWGPQDNVLVRATGNIRNHIKIMVRTVDIKESDGYKEDFLDSLKSNVFFNPEWHSTVSCRTGICCNIL